MNLCLETTVALTARNHQYQLFTCSSSVATSHGWARVGTCPPCSGHVGSRDLRRYEEFFWGGGEGVAGDGGRTRQQTVCIYLAPSLDPAVPETPVPTLTSEPGYATDLLIYSASSISLSQFSIFCTSFFLSFTGTCYTLYFFYFFFVTYQFLIIQTTDVYLSSVSVNRFFSVFN